MFGILSIVACTTDRAVDQLVDAAMAAGRAVDQVVEAIVAAGEQHRRRVSTATLNLEHWKHVSTATERLKLGQHVSSPTLHEVSSAAHLVQCWYRRGDHSWAPCSMRVWPAMRVSLASFDVSCRSP
eukprot:1152300-Pelagomonas_calceolata.AAC.3